jgi:hypothetical protein
LSKSSLVKPRKARTQFVAGELRATVPELSAFELHGLLLLEPQRDLVLRGFLFDQSPTRESAFDLHAYVLPLFVPGKEGTVGLSRWLRAFRLSEGEEKAVAAELRPTIIDKGLPILAARADYTGVAANAVEDGHWTMRRAAALEYRAYALLLAGEDDAASAALEEATASSEGQTSDVAQRCAQIKALLARSHDVAAEQLLRWAEESAGALGIEIPIRA